ncbi:MAG: glycosyltransferase [Bacteroidetes bacterium]|nr:MAG: glycosyltransferase [Bacteroidota bacterium]TAG89389.1 MAG: glycosyltransferase [Bacteroidota bacterium]
MAFITFLCPIRNRNIDFLVESLSNQTEKDFILMLINDSSDDIYTTKYKKFAEQYDFINYVEIANNTKKIWNKALVLNQGILLVKTENLIITDADLYFEKDFFRLLKQNYKQNKPYVCVFRRLLTKKDNELYLKNNQNYQYKKIIPHLTPNILVAKTSFFIEIGGYDTFFRIWGREDNEFYNAIRKKNIEVEVIDFEEAAIYHLWHQLENLDLPENWLYVLQTREQQSLALEKRPNFLKEEVPSFHHFSSYPIAFEYPLCFQINYIYHYWQQLKEGEIFYMKQNFDYVEIKKEKKISIFLGFLNKCLQKLKLNYRIIPIEKYQKKRMDFKEAKDFISYFILMQEKYIKDYEVNFDEKKLEIEWKMIKK